MDKEIGEVEKTQSERKLYDETQIEWKIADFFTFAENENSHFYESPCFSAGDASSLYFSIYPRSKSYPGFMTFSLNSKNPQKYAFEYKFSLKKSNGDTLNLKSGILEAYQTLSYSVGKLIEYSELLSNRSDLVPCNILTIRCTVKYEVARPIPEAALDKTKLLRFINLDKLSENFQDLFGDKETCDTTLKVNGKDYKAHRAVLVARSPVFAATFKHDSSEKQTGIITIPDCDPESFQEFLKYLYCGKLEDLSFQNALSLYVTSDKYDVQELKEFCVKYLIQGLTVESVCEIVVFADKYEEKELFCSAQDFFNKNICEIFETSEWEFLLEKDRRLANKLLKDMSKVKFK